MQKLGSLRCWITLWILNGGLVGYIIASGIGVIFAGTGAFPLVSRIWWIPIPTLIFLLLVRFMFHEELHGTEGGKDEVRS